MTAERIGKAPEYGDDAYEYSDGSIRNSRGHWMQRPPGSADMITKETASMLAKRSHEATKEKVQERLLKRAIEEGLTATCPADAYAAGVEHLWARSLELDEPLHAAVLAQKFVGSAGGFVEDRSGSYTDARQVTINVTADVAERLGVLGTPVDGGGGGAHGPLEDDDVEDE